MHDLWWHTSYSVLGTELIRLCIAVFLVGGGNGEKAPLRSVLLFLEGPAGGKVWPQRNLEICGWNQCQVWVGGLENLLLPSTWSGLVGKVYGNLCFLLCKLGHATYICVYSDLHACGYGYMWKPEAVRCLLLLPSALLLRQGLSLSS